MNIVVEKIFINQIEDFDAIREEWEKIEKGNDMTAYQSFSWNKLLVQEHFNTFFHNFFSSLIVYMVKDGDQIKIIFPIIVQKKSNKTKWFGREKGVYILGHASYSDYLNAIYCNTDDKAFEALVDNLKNDLGHYIFNFTDLVEGTSFEKFIERKGITKLESTVSVAVEKCASAEAYTKMLSKHVRQNLRTALNRMTKDGIKYEYKVIYGKIDDINVLEQLRELHINRMSEKNNVDTDWIHKLSSMVRINYRKRKELKNNVVYEGMKTLDNSVFVIVYLNNQISGYLYGLQEAHTVRIMQNCFRSDYKFYSPMFRGTYDFLIDCYQNDLIQKIDFTRGDESYKYQLAGKETVLKQYSGKFM